MVKARPPWAVVLVSSTAHALLVERTLRAAGLECKLVPVPRHLSSDCGVCVRIAQADRSAVENLVRAANHEIEGLFDW